MSWVKWNMQGDFVYKNSYIIKLLIIHLYTF